MNLIICPCSSHGIEVNVYDDGTRSLTFWSPKYSKSWGRLRWMLYILRHGYYNDTEFLLKDEELKQFIDALNEEPV